MEMRPKTDSRKPIAGIGRIGVLMGGPSSERDISLKSGEAVYNSLKGAGVEVEAIDITTDSPVDNARLIKRLNLDCAFLALHGRFGEDGTIQGILEKLGLVYTGSGVGASKLAMDKISSRSIFRLYGLDVPGYKVLDKASFSRNWKAYNNLSLPLVVKPAACGSSIGLSIVDKSRDLDKALEAAFKFGQRIILEEFIEGREVTVGILGQKCLPVIEIIPKKRFFDYEAKYQAGMTDYKVPAVLPPDAAKAAQDAAASAHKLLGCRGCSRVDMIIDRAGKPFVLEVNTIPGFTETSLLPKAAKVYGIDFLRLCLKLIELAYASR